MSCTYIYYIYYVDWNSRLHEIDKNINFNCTNCAISLRLKRKYTLGIWKKKKKKRRKRREKFQKNRKDMQLKRRNLIYVARINVFRWNTRNQLLRIVLLDLYRMFQGTKRLCIRWRSLTSSTGSTGTSRDSKCLTRSSWPPSAAQWINMRPFYTRKHNITLKMSRVARITCQRDAWQYERCRFASSASHSRPTGSSRPRFCRDTPDRTP